MAHEVDWLLRGCTLDEMRATADRPWRPWETSHGLRAVIRGDRLRAGRLGGRHSTPPVLRAVLSQERNGVRVRGRLSFAVARVTGAVLLAITGCVALFTVVAALHEGPVVLVPLVPVTLVLAFVTLVFVGQPGSEPEEAELRRRLASRFGPAPVPVRRQPRRTGRRTGRPGGR